MAEYPALHRTEDAVSPRIDLLLRRPFPGQTIALMGIVKRWQQARTAIVVAECGTGKTLISLGAMHVYSEGYPFTALGDGSSSLGREVGAGGVPDRAWDSCVPDRRLAERRRREHAARRQRSAVETRSDCLGRLAHHAHRHAPAKAMREFAPALDVVMHQTRLVHCRARAGEARLLLAPCLQSASFRILAQTSHEFTIYLHGLPRLSLLDHNHPSHPRIPP
jgi:hypothetical protein